MRLRLLFLFLISYLSSAISADAQCLMVPLSLSNRTTNSSVIIQGKLIHSAAYLSSNNRIFTSNLVKVNAYLKGHSTHSYIIVISEGGNTGEREEIVHPALELDKDHEFILMLKGENNLIDNKFYRLSYPGIPQMEAYACSQGKLTFQDNAYYDLLSESPLSESDIVNKINRFTGLPAKTPDNQPFYPRNETDHSNSKIKGISKITAISGVSPNPGIAGTINVSDQITITGSGFGAAPGTVEFSNADDGGGTFIQSPVPTTDIISWSDVQIIMKLPRRAGTGIIRVNGTFTFPYTVTYAHIEINSTTSGFGSLTRQRSFLVNRDGSGGYTFQYNTTFAANLPAVAAFERALATWRCNTFVNFNTSTTTTAITLAGLDGVNVVSFDVTLPVGVLGRATTQSAASGNAGCNLQNTVWRSSEIDIQFQDPPAAGFTWNYGPTASIAFGTTYDFESVALHELGHAHGLGHINAAGNVMHYNLLNGADARVLNPSTDIAGGNAKMAYSTLAANYCIQYPAGVVGPMTALTSGNCLLPISLLTFTGKRIDKNQTILEWITNEEWNNRGFELLRSYDGNNFTTIAFIPSLKNEKKQKKYSYQDYLSENIEIVYYKLIQIDLDNHSTEYPILQLNLTIVNSANVSFDHENKTIQLSFSKVLSEEIEWCLYNGIGQMLIKEKLPKGTFQKSYPTWGFTSGIYTYSIWGEIENNRGKVVLQ